MNSYRIFNLYDRYVDRLEGAYDKIVRKARLLENKNIISRFFVVRQYDVSKHLTLGYLPSRPREAKKQLEEYFSNLKNVQHFDGYDFRRSREWSEIDDIKAYAMKCYLIPQDRIGYSTKLSILHHHYLNYAGFYGQQIPTTDSVRQEAHILQQKRAAQVNDNLFRSIRDLYVGIELRKHVERLNEGFN